MAVDLLILSGCWTALRMHEVFQYGKPNPPGPGANGFTYNSKRSVFSLRSLGPEKIAWRVRQAGYTCQVLSGVHYYTLEHFKKLFAKFVGPKTVVAFSAVFVTERTDLESILSIIKNFVPKGNKTLLGGQSASVWNDIIKDVYGYSFDYVIHGYAENEIVEFMHKYFNNGIQKKRTSHWDIVSCNFKWDMKACVASREALPLETGRGCIFECKFCRFGLLGKKKGTYERNMDLVKQELISNYENFGTTHYLLADDTFNDTPSKIESWVDMLSSLPFSIKYAAYLRADLLHRYPHTIPLLRDSGLKGTHFGIETIHPKASKAIGKGWSGKHAREFVPYIRDVLWNKEVMIHISMIAGLPYETLQDLDHTKKWLYDNQISGAITALNLRTKGRKIVEQSKSKIGTSIFDREAEKYGYIVNEALGPIDNWELNGLTYKDTAKYCAQFNLEWQQHCRVPSFEAIELLALGVSFDKLQNTPKANIFSDKTVYNETARVIDRYVQKLLQL